MWSNKLHTDSPALEVCGGGVQKGANDFFDVLVWLRNREPRGLKRGGVSLFSGLGKVWISRNYRRRL